MIKQQYLAAFRLQACYALLCVIWNGVAIWQIQAGVQPIGPTASGAVIMGAVIVVALLAWTLDKAWELAYTLVALLILLLSLSAVYSGFTGSPESWPSEFWRMAGVLVNLLGVASFMVVLWARIRARG